MILHLNMVVELIQMLLTQHEPAKNTHYYKASPCVSIEVTYMHCCMISELSNFV